MDTAARTASILAALLLTPGCIWVSDKELSERQGSLVDLDGDGYENEFGDGQDCDDSDKAIFPGATEIWYDDVDQDCAGGDDHDADDDGFAAGSGGGADCDDGEATVYPGAPDPWYDGVDQDCDGNDADQDGDGYDAEVMGGDDCDDTNLAINPGAAEIWYDDVDQDCDMADDFDRDGDGHRSDDYGGDDCDDGDAQSYPGAEEIWYDGADQDCAGGSDFDADGDGFDSAAYSGDDCFDDDSGRVEDYPQIGEVRANDCGDGSGSLDYTVLDLRDSTATSGPRLAATGDLLSVAWGYETADDPSPGIHHDGLGSILVDLSDPGGGELSYTLFSYPSDSGDFGEPLDTALTDSYYIWSSALLDDISPGTGRRIYLDFLAADESEDLFNQVAVDQELEHNFQDVQLTMLPGEDLRLIACEETLGTVYVMDGTVDELSADRSGAAYTTKINGAAGDRCEYWPGEDRYVLASAAAGTLGFYSRSGAQFTEQDLLEALDIRDIEADGDTLVAAEATEGLMIWDSAGSLSEPALEVTEQIDAVEVGGQVVICAIDAVGAATLYYGDSTGLASLSVAGSLGGYDDCGLAAGAGDLVFLALRAGDAVEYTYGYVP